MPCTIEDLPTELNLQIAAYLRRHDLTRLMQATKYFYSLVEPLLWKSIELHKPGFHKDCNGYVGMQDQKWFYMDAENSLSSLKYGQAEREFAKRSAKFLQICEALRRNFPQRWQKLSKLTHYLCLTFEPFTKDTPDIIHDKEWRHHNESPRDIWNTFASFSNLQSIDLIGEWNNGGDPLDSVRPSAFDLMNRLRKVRLRGYISREFVLHICQNSASSITHLDLGLLELPIGNALLKERKRNVADLTDLEENEAEMLSADFVAPSGLSWLPSDLPGSFKSLTHLVLCKPTEPFYEDIGDAPHDRQVLAEWASLLCGVSNTLVELTLDHRTVAWGITLDNIECDAPAHNVVETQGHERFCEIVLPVLIDPKLDWSALQRITLRGICIDDEQYPSGDQMILLKDQFPHVDVDVKAGNYMFIDSVTGAVVQWGGHDGLLPDKDELESEDGSDDEDMAGDEVDDGMRLRMGVISRE